MKSNRACHGRGGACPVVPVPVLVLLLLLGGTPGSAYAQQGSSGGTQGVSQGAGQSPSQNAAQTPAQIAATQPTQSLPRGFQDILLGLPVDMVKQLLEKSTYFSYHGGPEVTLTPKGKQTIIETNGVSYIQSAIFQFNDGNLYTITIHLNPAMLDFYSMYTDLVGKYGQPTSLSPSDVVWLSDQVRFSLEKPLTIKYINEVVFQKLQEEGKAKESLQQLSRDEFINLF